MATTSRRALPYPIGSDNADVPADIQALAEALDNAALDIPQGTTLPVSGDEGDYFWKTNEGLQGVLYRHNGSAWRAINPEDAAAATPSLRTLGTGSTQAAAGNDSRFSDNRTPTDNSVTTAKVHTSLKPSSGASASTEALRALGTSASTACAGNDSRLSDSRTPTTHASSHIRGAADEIDGDLIDVDYTPSAYTRATGSPGSNAEHLAAHLRGIDNELATIQRPSLVDTLPGSPAAGDEVYFQTAAMLAAKQPPLHLRYNGSYGDAYEWDVLGVSSWRAAIATSETLTTGTTWRNLATTGPDITAPLAGIYNAHAVCDVAATVGDDVRLGIANGSNDPATSDFVVGTQNGSVTSSIPLSCQAQLTMAASGTIRARYYNNGSTNAFRRRSMIVTPVRVG